ncbi:MAG TPA: hypothetical protein PKM59_03680 [Thermodesulfobacteriota bacterium]|nr:hypothetical protein [Thermodesulfobacteriota bacterium]HNU70916.1 hypothetical protein [Thermodesulfobacteriota bacterium]
MKKLILSSFIVMSVVVAVLISAGLQEVRAEVKLTDCLSVAGYLRAELAVHTASQNPNNVQDDNNRLNFARSYFQTEWNYTPTDRFKVFSKIRLMGDFTEDIDSDLGKYDAFPLDVAEDDWTMMKMSERDWRAEVWELYADWTIDKLWLRAGRQQIVWGEMIASRIMDIINPLDMSRNFLFEPEEFENIRIPEWMLRARYSHGQIGGLINDFIVEGFFNPGDVYPTQYADVGSPFYLGTDLENSFPFFRINDKDRRGDEEYGIRLGGMLGSLYMTLNYLSLYSPEFMLEQTGIAPDPISGIPIFAPADFTLYDLLFDAEYPAIDVFGITANYFVAPLNTVTTFEGTWTPNQPYQDARVAATGGTDYTDQGTWNWAIRFDRQTFVFPRPTSSMMIQVQFNQTIREGDDDDLLGAGNSRVDKTDETISLLLDQFFSYNNYRTTLLFVHDFDGGNYVKPSFRYTYGDHWFFDLYAVFLAGSDERPGRFGGLKWADEVVTRVTYQF